MKTKGEVDQCLPVLLRWFMLNSLAGEKSGAKLPHNLEGRSGLSQQLSAQHRFQMSASSNQQPNQHVKRRG